MARFQVRARTVDMLGRQQIAGIPTAISELFKNAHDAYARKVEVDYYRDDGLFVLRDDGLGMTREDFEQRWLTLGTDSKIVSADLQPPPIDPDQPVRQIQGEKGIGRLAIAIIGPQVLVLSRAKVNGIPSNETIVAYLHWGLFELPNLNLEDINIPVRAIPGGTLPSRDDVADFVAEATAELGRLASLSDSNRVKGILSEMNAFNADPLEYSEYLGGPSLLGSGCGTHFYIIPTDPIIKEDIDNRQAVNKATRFEKNLIGFTNTMTPGHENPPIIASFRDHRNEGSPDELIGQRAFFTPDEFNKVDHHFIGQFDKHGQFRGTVGIYQREQKEYVLNWNESDGKPTDCGPFSLSVAYMQGKPIESLVTPKEFTRLKRKLERHGGIYIYRDGIRVQPYGDSDYDWLDIERNRTLGAGFYFYSYRRMFGIIELSQFKNGKLTEKAGREGFRENKAYRQLRSILMNFFLQTAADFFRVEGEFADAHFEIKDELKLNEKIRRQNARKAQQKKTSLQNSLQNVFTLIDEQTPELETEEYLIELKRDVDIAILRKAADQQKAQDLMRCEEKSRAQLHKLRNRFTVTKPRGVGLSRQLSNEWNSYQVQMKRLKSEVFEPTERGIEKLVSAAAAKAKVPLNDIVRLNNAVSKHGKDALKTAKEYRRTTNTLTDEIATTVKDEALNSFQAISLAVNNVMVELNYMRSVDKDIDDLPEIREKLVERITSVHEVEKLKMERLRDQLNLITNLWKEDSYDSAELTEALEEKLEELETQRNADFELAQTGMALNTISHEFDKTVGALRNGLRKLKAWADMNPELNDLYQDLRISFDHLDEYLTMFTPLDRRLHRKKIRITGKQIHDFVSKLFQSRLNRHRVTLSVTNKFLKSSMLSFPSSLYPPFINLVDNSIFWLQSNHDRLREITLDAEGCELLVRDNGPGVSARDQENIFVMNFSRKPGGRGMGLHISRETLFRVGLNLTLDIATGSQGAIFRISPKNNNSVAEETK